MAEPQESVEVAAAIQELAKQVDALGNAVISAAQTIAQSDQRRNQRSGRPAARSLVELTALTQPSITNTTPQAAQTGVLVREDRPCQPHMIKAEPEDPAEAVERRTIAPAPPR